MCNLKKNTIAIISIPLIALLVVFDPNNNKIKPIISSIGSFGYSTIHPVIYWINPPPKCDDKEGCQFIVKSAVYGEKTVNGTFVDLARLHF